MTWKNSPFIYIYNYLYRGDCCLQNSSLSPRNAIPPRASRATLKIHSNEKQARNLGLSLNGSYEDKWIDEGCNKKKWPVQNCPISLQNMQIWELKVHEILYRESVGVLIMFPDELLSNLKSKKKAYRALLWGSFCCKL